MCKYLLLKSMNWHDALPVLFWKRKKSYLEKYKSLLEISTRNVNQKSLTSLLEVLGPGQSVTFTCKNQFYEHPAFSPHSGASCTCSNKRPFVNSTPTCCFSGHYFNERKSLELLQKSQWKQTTPKLTSTTSTKSWLYTLNSHRHELNIYLQSEHWDTLDLSRTCHGRGVCETNV